MSQMKAYNFLNPSKIAIQHLNLFFYRQIGPYRGDISLTDMERAIFPDVVGVSVWPIC